MYGERGWTSYFEKETARVQGEVYSFQNQSLYKLTYHCGKIGYHFAQCTQHEIPNLLGLI